MENTPNSGNGDAHKAQTERPFIRVTIEVRNSPGDAFENLQEKLSEKANAILNFIRRGVEIRVEAGAKGDKTKAERITIE